MSKKTIYLTESQYNTIVGIDNSENSNIPPYTATEITTGGITGEDEPVLSDKISNSLSTTGLGNRRTGLYCGKNNKKKIVEGGNSKIVDKTYKIPDNLLSHLNDVQKQYGNNGEAGSKRNAFLTQNGEINGEHAYEIQSEMSDMEKESTEYQRLGGDEMLNWLNNTLGRDASLAKKSKQIKTDMGFENAFIKKHTKNNGGKAHTPKNNNVLNVQFEK